MAAFHERTVTEFSHVVFDVLGSGFSRYGAARAGSRTAGVAGRSAHRGWWRWGDQGGASARIAGCVKRDAAICRGGQSRDLWAGAISAAGTGRPAHSCAAVAATRQGSRSASGGVAAGLYLPARVALRG